jgi:large subunit ribosomal protein L7/L12
MSETTTATKERSPEIQGILDQIKKFTILQVNELVEGLEDEFGVSAAMPMMAGPMMGGGGAAAAPVEEKTEWNVILTGFGANKIGVIKTIRELTGLGLKEAKDLVDGVPKPVKENANKEEVAKMKAAIEAAGGTVEVK